MKLSACKFGILVVDCRSYRAPEVSRIGMVIGITQNSTREAIPLVQWQGSAECVGFHHAHLAKFEE